MSHLRWAWGFLLLGTLGCSPSVQPKKTRVVLITIDTLREDRFSGPNAKMPELLKASARGQVLSDFYAATSTTQPTHATLMTGQHPWQHGVSRNGLVLDDKAVTMAELFQAAGFTTSAVVASFPLHSQFGFAQGFDEYDDDFDRGAQDKWVGRTVEGSFYRLGGRVSQSALSAIDQAQGEQQFFWFHYYDPHAPYGDTGSKTVGTHRILAAAEAKSPELEEMLESARQAYDADVLFMDRAIGRVLDRLEADEDEYETHILLTTDHGESFGEEGSLGHGKRLIRSQVHVPTVLWSPAIEPGVLGDALGSVDVLATLLQLADLAAPETNNGRSLLDPREPGTVAVGMRRSFETPFREVRMDGSVRHAKGPRFFSTSANGLVIGDALQIEGVGAQGLSDEQRQAYKELFAGFTVELAGQSAAEVLDQATLDALSDLGYTR